VLPGLPHSFETPKEAILCLTVGIGIAVAVVGGVRRPPAGIAGPGLAFVGAGVAASAGHRAWRHPVTRGVGEVLLFALGLSAFGAPEARTAFVRAVVATAAAEAVLAAVGVLAGPAAVLLVGSAPRRLYALGTLGVPNWVGALDAMALAPAL